MKTHLIAIIKFLIIFSLLISCSTETTPEYILTASVQPEESGLITPSSGVYRKSESVQITATPNEHWIFLRWEGDLTGSNPAAAITMNSDMDITALFVKRDYPLTIEIEGEGTVTEQIIQHKTTNYQALTVINLAAEPVEGWSFSHWEGDSDGQTNPIEVTIDREKTIKAVFVRNSYPLTINMVGSGTVQKQVIQRKTTEYPYQTTVELTAVPDQGWVFNGWQGDLTGNENPVSIEVNQATEITAVFEKGYFDVNIQVEGMGSTSITLLTGDRVGDSFEYDSEIMIEVIPQTGWSFMGWEGDLTGSENPIQIVVNSSVSATANLYQVPFEGEGSAENPYRIQSLDQLNSIRNPIFMSKHFIQMNDIIASETATWNDGSGFTPIGFNDIIPFTGVYDGKGYQISGLTIDISDDVFYGNVAAGLFGYTKSATIRNLMLNDVSIRISTNAVIPVGAAVGMAGEGTEINNVHAEGTVTGKEYTGGLIGVIDNGTVIGSSANVTVQGHINTGGLIGYAFVINVNASSAGGNATVQGHDNTGGLIGYANGTSVNASYATVQVTGNQQVGGLIGRHENAKKVHFSHATGAVSGEINVGGLIGASFNTAEAVAWSYATGDVQGSSNIGGLIGAFSGNSSVGEVWASGNVTSSEGNFTGGLIGRLFAGNVVKSYALGKAALQEWEVLPDVLIRARRCGNPLQPEPLPEILRPGV